MSFLPDQRQIQHILFLLQSSEGIGIYCLSTAELFIYLISWHIWSLLRSLEAGLLFIVLIPKDITIAQKFGFRV